MTQRSKMLCNSVGETTPARNCAPEGDQSADHADVSSSKTASGRRLVDFYSGYALQLVSSSSDGIVFQDLQGRIEWMNPAAQTLYGVELEDVLGTCLKDLLPDAREMQTESTGPFHYDANAPIFNAPRIAQHKDKSGHVFWHQQHFNLLDVNGQKMVGIVCRDVTDQVDKEHGLRAIQAKLQHAAHHDHLTGLANRHRLRHHLETEQFRRSVIRQEVGILQLDVDKFKEINDTLGHAAGDATLQHFAAILRKSSRPRDLVCRSGGDEFIMVCDGMRSSDALLARAELVKNHLCQPFTWRDRKVRIGTSIGASLCASGEETAQDLILQADQALYAAKDSGRGKVVFYTPQLGKSQKEQNLLTQDVRNAVADEQLEVYLQPLIDLQSRAVTGFETLLRWNHPQKGLLHPDAFFSLADQAGVLADLDYQSMHLSLDALQTLHRAGHTDLGISLNASAEILGDHKYPDLLNWALQSRSLNPTQVCIEINETALGKQSKTIIATATEHLRQVGVQVALDDFGTGFAGLAHFAITHVDIVKIDASLIKGVGHSERNRQVVSAIINLCQSLNAQIVAEAVEKLELLDFLQFAGCTAAQGFCIAKPMPIEDAVHWMDRFSSEFSTPDLLRRG